MLTYFRFEFVLGNECVLFFIRYHTHQVEEDTPECRTTKEYKCETKTKGYSSEEVK